MSCKSGVDVAKIDATDLLLFFFWLFFFVWVGGMEVGGRKKTRGRG